MYKKKVVVFDNQNYISKVLKNKFHEEISFDLYKKFKYFDKSLKEYSIAIFVIYSEDEILNLMKVYKKKIPLIICSFNKETLKNLRKIDNIMLLDASKILPEIVNQLKIYFSRLNILDEKKYQHLIKF